MKGSKITRPIKPQPTDTIFVSSGSTVRKKQLNAGIVWWTVIFWRNGSSVVYYIIMYKLSNVNKNRFQELEQASPSTKNFLSSLIKDCGMRGKVRRVTYSDSYFSRQYYLFPFHIEDKDLEAVNFTWVNPNLDRVTCNTTLNVYFI